MSNIKNVKKKQKRNSKSSKLTRDNGIKYIVKKEKDQAFNNEIGEKRK